MKYDILSAGKLAHAVKIIVLGRIFLRRMTDVTHKAKQLDHLVHLTAEFKSDLAFFRILEWSRNDAEHLGILVPEVLFLYRCLR